MDRHIAWQARQDRKNALQGLIDTGAVSSAIKSQRFDMGKPEYEAANAEAFADARAWIPGTGNVVVHGNVGLGKTWLAYMILAQAWDNGLSVASIRSIDFVKRCKVPIWQPGSSMDAYIWTALWMLDDGDKGPHTDITLSRLFDVIDQRCDNGRSTIITTNLSYKGLRDSWLFAVRGNDSIVTAILDRLQPLVAIELRGVSLRRAAFGKGGT